MSAIKKLLEESVDNIKRNTLTSFEIAKEVCKRENIKNPELNIKIPDTIEELFGGTSVPVPVAVASSAVAASGAVPGAVPGAAPGAAPETVVPGAETVKKTEAEAVAAGPVVEEKEEPAGKEVKQVDETGTNSNIREDSGPSTSENITTTEAANKANEAAKKTDEETNKLDKLLQKNITVDDVGKVRDAAKQATDAAKQANIVANEPTNNEKTKEFAKNAADKATFAANKAKNAADKVNFAANETLMNLTRQKGGNKISTKKRKYKKSHKRYRYAGRRRSHKK